METSRTIAYGGIIIAVVALIISVYVMSTWKEEIITRWTIYDICEDEADAAAMRCNAENGIAFDFGSNVPANFEWPDIPCRIPDPEFCRIQSKIPNPDLDEEPIETINMCQDVWEDTYNECLNRYGLEPISKKQIEQ